MMTLPLTYYQRVVLWNMIGSYQAPSLKMVSVYVRLIEKVRLTDEESIDSKFNTNGAAFSWNLPRPGFGNKVVDLENDEAKALVECIESASPVRVSDASWLTEVISSLTPQEVEKSNA